MSLLRNSVATLFGRSNHSKRRENIVAIDLGAEHTKAVYLQRKSDRCLLAGYARLDTPTGPNPYAPEILGPHLRAVVNATGARTRRITLVVGPNDALIRHAEMPMVPVPDMRIMLKLGSKTYLQQDLPDHLFDCHLQSLLTETKKPESNRTLQKCRVLVGGVKRQFLENLRAAARQADLSLDTVTSSLIAPANAFEMAFPDAFAAAIVALVDIGAKTSTITILLNGQVILNRIVNFGSARVVQGVQEALGVDAKSLGGLQNIPATDLEGVLPALLIPLGRELRASIDFFEHQEDKQVAQAFFSGGLARLEPAVQALQSELMVPCQTWNPLSFLQFALPPEQLGEIEGLAPQLTIAVGGAIAAF
ncbi:pilus assembly protein PilM [Verrucomicrobiota bacterium]|nr:pilus assembly protein PilM [Verrucomicrobiota bacterium]